MKKKKKPQKKYLSFFGNAIERRENKLLFHSD